MFACLGVLAACSAGFKFEGLKVRSPRGFFSCYRIDWERSLFSWQKLVTDVLRRWRFLRGSGLGSTALEFEGLSILRIDAGLGLVCWDIIFKFNLN